MVLTGVTLFPQGLLPLYIFEPRYREMLKQCLDGERMFGVVSMDHLPEKQQGTNQKIIAGVGVIRACVEQEDGTSQLILQGISRVCLTRFVQTAPVLISEIEPLKSTHCDNVEVDALSGRLREMIHEMTLSGTPIPHQVMDYLDKTRDPDILADLISYLILKRADYRKEIMQTLDLRERYRKLLHMVPDELKKSGMSEPDQK